MLTAARQTDQHHPHHWQRRAVFLRNLTAFTVVVLAVRFAAAAPAPGPDAEPRAIDTSQAELMVAFLERAGQGDIDADAVEKVLASPGTALVIGQMNLMRRVSAQQYRTVLLGLGHETPPTIEPADGGERARSGVAGLTDNVWPTLRWGMQHSDLLRKRIAEIKALDVYGTARHLAVSALPGAVDVAPDVFVVMGGRAGAAALAGPRIYVDVLLLSYLDAIGRRPWSAEADVLGFVAHEMHHIGYRTLLDRYRESLQLTSTEEPAYRLLTGLLSEGSATYLVSDRRDLARLRSDTSLDGLLERGDELLAECGSLLTSLLAKAETSPSEDAVRSFLLGSRAHAAGSLMLSRIDRLDGLDAVMAVLRDPRTLLQSYNRAVSTFPDLNGAYRFDPILAESVAQLGVHDVPSPD